MKRKFFGVDIYIFEVDTLLEHIKFVNLILEEKPFWIKSIIKNTEKWNIAKKHELFIGLAKINGKFSSLMPDYPVFVKGESLYLVQIIKSSHCSICESKYSAFYIRDYNLYFGFPEETYEWAMSVPYITHCLNCGANWDEPGKRFLAIFQNGKEKYAV